MSVASCFPEVPNNKFIQDAVISEVFKILESSNTEKELQDRINNALEQEVAKGTIVLDNKQINTISEKVGPALAALTACKIEEGLNTSVSPAELANSITNFLCNLPKFDFEKFRIKFDFDLTINIEKIADMLIQIFIDIMFALLADLLTIVVDLCEFSLDIGFGDQVEQMLNNSFMDVLGSKLLNGFNLTLDILSNIFMQFNIDFSTGNYIGETGEDCTPAINTIRPASEFLGSVSQSLSSKEMCQLLAGNPSQSTLNKIKEILEFEYPTLFNILKTDEKIIELFKTIGYYVSPEACMTQPESFDNLCNFNDLNVLKKQLLEARGLTEEQVKEAMEADAKRLKEKMFKVANLIAKLKENPDSIFDDVSTNLLCSGNKTGKFTMSDFPNIVTANKFLADLVYDKIRNSYVLDSQKTVENNIKFDTKRKFIRKVVSNYTTTNPDGRSETVNESVLNPLFLKEVESGNKLFIVISNADTNVANENIQINKEEIIGFPTEGDQYTFGDYSKILSTPDAYAEIYNTDMDYIVGIVAEYKERSSSTTFGSSTTSTPTTNNFASNDGYGLSYTISDGDNIVGNLYDEELNTTPITQLRLRKEATAVGFLTDNSVIDINEVKTSKFNSSKFSRIKFDINGVTRNLTKDELDSLESSKNIYPNFEPSDAPFRHMNPDLLSIIHNKLPELNVNSSERSSQEQVFAHLTGESYESYATYGTALLEKIKDFNISSLKEPDYQSFVDLYFTEGLMRTNYEKQQYLDKFLNDPCSLSMESLEENTSPAALALASELIRLFIKVHVIKNVIKNMPFLYHFDPYELVKHDDSFMEFTLQTLKNEIEYFTTNKQQFKQIVDSQIDSKFKSEYESNEYTIYDPITGDEYPEGYESLSLDFKYRYFIKKEFMGLLKSFRRAFAVVKGGQEPISFDTFMVSTMVYDDLRPEGFNLVACYLDEKQEKFRTDRLSNLSYAKQAAIFLVLNREGHYYEIKVSSTYLKDGQQFSDVRSDLIKQMRENHDYRIMIEFCFNSSKFLSFNYVNELIVFAKNSYSSTSIMMITAKTIRDLIFQLLESNLEPDSIPDNCHVPTLSNHLDLPDFDYIKELLLRLLIEAPITIIKLVAESFDPSISVSNQIRNLVEMGASYAAGQKIELPILPFVLGLWPTNWLGWGPPITNSLGIPYLIIDTIQSSIALSNLKLKKVDLLLSFNFDFKDPEFELENPYPPEC